MSWLRRYTPYAALALVVAEIVLMLGSWLYSAAYPASGVHSLLSGEGIRWFLGHFADMLATPVLVWLLLLAMAWGSLRASGILRLQRPAANVQRSMFNVQRPYRSRRALWLSFAYLIIYICVVLLLTVVPHAVLLSASGSLWPSPFSAAAVPMLAFGLMSTALVYGTVAGTFHSLSDISDSLLDGIRRAAPLLLFYILLAQICESLRFVLP